MDSEQFCLSWNNFHNNISSGFQALLQEEGLVDVTLAAEGHYIKAHKVVLSICSPYFKELFQTNPCKHPIVILHDVSYSAISALLKFMYRGEVSVSQDEIPTFMKVAEVLKIKGLGEHAKLKSIPENGLEINNATKEQCESPQPNSRVDQQSIMKGLKMKFTKPVRKSEYSDPSPSNSLSPSPVNEPPLKQPRLEEPILKQSGYSEPLIKPKPEPLDMPPEDHHYREQSYDDRMDMTNFSSYSNTSAMDKYGESAMDKYGESAMDKYGESSDNSIDMKMNRFYSDVSSPGTLQCILGKRGLPRLIVDGYTFFKKSTYKNKCFWYCKTNRSFRCPAVCWTVNGKIVKWPEMHNHGIVPEVIQPGEDTIVPIEMLTQVLIDAAR